MSHIGMGFQRLKFCLVWAVAQMAKNSCCIQRKLKPQVGDPTALGCAILLHMKAKSLRNVCVYVLAYDLHRFEIAMILVKLHKPTRVLESNLWSKIKGRRSTIRARIAMSQSLGSVMNHPVCWPMISIDMRLKRSIIKLQIHQSSGVHSLGRESSDAGQQSGQEMAMNQSLGSIIYHPVR